MRPGLAVAATLALVAIACVDPAQARWFPACPLHAATGLFCPGCGATRALHALAHGDPARALAFNPLLILALPVLVPLAADEAWRVATGRAWLRTRVPTWAGFTILAVLCAYGVLRNVPGFEWLGPIRE
ncbi:MAG TPA: DUF2752 domain-containing protein [Candidatus Polarisedimenticolaceae bacterium]